LNISPEKQKRLKALSDQRGIIGALAIDQRSALRKLFAKSMNVLPQDVPERMLVEYKSHVSEILTPHASAILLDPEYGLPAAVLRDKSAGLLLAYEKTGYEAKVPGRMPNLLNGFTVERLKNEGADAVKVLLYYSPASAPEINAKKHDFVEQVGAECQAADVPFFLELVSYHDEMDEKGPQFARMKPDVVTRSVEEFCKARYAVDVLKVGVPVNMRFVESASVARGDALYSRADAAAYFRRASDASLLPFIYLSEGVSNELFSDALELAAEAGSAFSGVLCGRATWQDGVPIFVKSGGEALEEWLTSTGTQNIERVNARLAAAHPWEEKLSAAGQAGL
jgi:tagatose 1,6-diphosphate aldolase